MKAAGWIGVAVSRFNEDVTGRLLASCLAALRAGGYSGKGVRLLRVPGGFELPWAVNELARAKGCRAVVALGCILKGSTPQNEHIARSMVHHLHDISLKTRVPVLLGVITPNTHKQAMERTKGTMDRGREAAEAAIQMAALGN